MPPQAPWSPTAQAFAHHQFSHVVNFWKQGRQANFRLEVLPGGQAELNLTFRLPSASQVIPPPSHVPQVLTPQRPIHPLFPKGCSPQKSGADCVTKPASSKKVSSRQRKSYRRSVLHRAVLAAPSLPPSNNGTLRQAALACVQRQQAVSASPVSPTQSPKKRPLPDSPSALSPSNFPPLSQRIRKDIQIGESEVESPEKEVLRSPPHLENSPSPISPSLKCIPSPGPLVFTPEKLNLHCPNCLNCDVEMTPDHQCESGGEESEIIGINEVDVKESFVVEKDKSVEDEQVIGSAEVEQIEPAKIEQALESVLKPTQVEQVIESAKVEQTEVIEQVIESAKVEQAEVYYCYNCGLEGHFARECPFQRLKYSCYNCGGEGHFARDCDK